MNHLKKIFFFLTVCFGPPVIACEYLKEKTYSHTTAEQYKKASKRFQYLGWVCGIDLDLLSDKSSWIGNMHLLLQRSLLRRKIGKLRDPDSVLSKELIDEERHCTENSSNIAMKLAKKRLQRCHQCLKYLWAQKVIDEYQHPAEGLRVPKDKWVTGRRV